MRLCWDNRRASKRLTMEIDSEDLTPERVSGDRVTFLNSRGQIPPVF